MAAEGESKKDPVVFHVPGTAGSTLVRWAAQGSTVPIIFQELDPTVDLAAPWFHKMTRGQVVDTVFREGPFILTSAHAVADYVVETGEGAVVASADAVDPRGRATIHEWFAFDVTHLRTAASPAERETRTTDVARRMVGPFLTGPDPTTADLAVACTLATTEGPVHPAVTAWLRRLVARVPPLTAPVPA